MRGEFARLFEGDAAARRGFDDTEASAAARVMRDRFWRSSRAPARRTAAAEIVDLAAYRARAR